MSELEDMIGKILGDPASMERISGLASQLMGGGEEKKAESEPLLPGLDPAMLSGIGKLMAGMNSDGGKAELVAALGPYLKPERRSKLEKAVKISRLAHVAGLALEEYGNGYV